MIWSVSTSSRMRTDTGPVIVSMAFMIGWVVPLLVPVADVDEAAGDRGGGGHLGADEVRAAARALAALEVAVRGRRAALAGLQLVRVHGQAHRAARPAPVEARGGEALVQACGLGLRLALHRARDDHRVDVAADLLALDHPGGGAQIADARVGARADEHAVERDLLDRRAGL